MNRTIKTRLAKLEAYNSVPDDHPEAIFVEFVDGRKGGKPEETPIAGWSLWSGDHKVWRASGETDQQLKQRAIAEVRTMIKPEATPGFFQLFEEDHQS